MDRQRLVTLKQRTGDAMKYLLLMALLASGAAQAGLVTADNAHLDDVTLSLWSGGGTIENGVLPPATLVPSWFLAEHFENETFANEFQTVLANTAGRDLSSENGRFFYGFDVFRADFTQPTDFVDIFGGGFGEGDPFTAYAYDSAGKLLGGTWCEPGVGLLQNGPCDISFGAIGGTANIAFVTAAGTAAGQIVSSMIFNEVPEPGTLGLMAFALVMMATWSVSRTVG